MSESRPTLGATLAAVAVGAGIVIVSSWSGLAAYQSGRSARPAHLDHFLPSHAPGAWFDPTTASALSDELAAALDGSGWCAGWVVVVDDVLVDQADIGSNLGVGEAAHTCDDWAEITVEVVYTSESSEADDTAGIRVDASDPGVETALASHPSLLDGTGYRALLGDAGDDAVANAVAGLPAALAEVGEITPVAAAPVEDGDPGGVAMPDAEGDGGNETWAQQRSLVLVGVAFLVAAVVVLAVLAVHHVRAGRRRPGHARGAAPGPVNPRRVLRAALVRAQTPPPGAVTDTAAARPAPTTADTAAPPASQTRS